MRLVRTVVALWTALCFTGCTSMQPIKESTPQNAREQLEVGDEVRVVATNGTAYELVVTRVGDDSFSGKAENGKHYKVPYAAIQSIEAEQVSAAKTGGAIGATTIVLYIAAIAFFVMVAEDIGEAFSCIFGQCEDD